MCGRFTLTESRKADLEKLGSIELPPLFTGRYNIAPTQQVAILKQPEKVADCIWGFRNPHSGASIINARSETLRERPLFRDLVSDHRCLIPADGFFEWKGRKPYYFQLPDKALFAFAGLWREDRCVIITRAADRNMQGIHDRMPVIFTMNEAQDWLTEFRIPDHAPALTVRPVSSRVNKVANDDPGCILSTGIQTDLFP